MPAPKRVSKRMRPQECAWGCYSQGKFSSPRRKRLEGSPRGRRQFFGIAEGQIEVDRQRRRRRAFRAHASSAKDVRAGVRNVPASGSGGVRRRPAARPAPRAAVQNPAARATQTFAHDLVQAMVGDRLAFFDRTTAGSWAAPSLRPVDLVVTQLRDVASADLAAPRRHGDALVASGSASSITCSSQIVPRALGQGRRNAATDRAAGSRTTAVSASIAAAARHRDAANASGRGSRTGDLGIGIAPVIALNGVDLPALV